MKCKYCNKGNDLGKEKRFHNRCERVYMAKNIPKSQKKKLSICPHCKKKFYYWQKGFLHANEEKHWGNYQV